MPKVNLDPTASLETLLYGYIAEATSEADMTQTDLANEIGYSQQRLNYKIKNRALTAKDLLRIFGTLKPDAETLFKVMRGNNAR